MPTPSLFVWLWKLELPSDSAAPLQFEAVITDSVRVRRRLLFSTAFREPTVTALHVQVALFSECVCVRLCGLCAHGICGGLELRAFLCEVDQLNCFPIP
jgi:hypothetical protein